MEKGEHKEVHDKSVRPHKEVLMSADFIVRVADKLGVPAAMIVVLCAAIWFTGSWTANHVVDPLIKGHTEFLKAEQDNMGKIATAVDHQTDLLRNIRDDQRKFPAVAENTPMGDKTP